MLSGGDTIWQSVLAMESPITVPYTQLEELFGRKETGEAETKTEKKQPKEVRIML